MPVRNIVRIDEELCDGCGKCATACAEGAIEMTDGKARLVSDNYCDGLGACIGECPQGAITVERREAEPFDEKAVMERAKMKNEKDEDQGTVFPAEKQAEEVPEGSGERAGEEVLVPSMLKNWPVQVKLLPAKAPYYENANLLIAGDCVPFAFADFHRKFLPGMTVLIGCPKLDDTDFFFRKLTQIFLQNDVKSATVVHMEVPCCFGLVRLVQQALAESGKQDGIPLTSVKIGIEGEVLETVELPPGEELPGQPTPQGGAS